MRTEEKLREEIIKKQPNINLIDAYGNHWNDLYTDDVINSAMDEFGSLVKPKWISVEDELPEDTEMKLVFHQGEFKIAACVTDIRTYWIRMQGNRTIEFVGVTHWMDLPEIPRTKNPEN